MSKHIDPSEILPCPLPIDKRFKDLTGRKFGNFNVLGLAGIRKTKYYWKCECSCGKTKTIWGSSLLNGSSKSCGCGLIGNKRGQIHGKYGTPENRVWNGMRSRCLNKNTAGYHRYGGRGIRVCGRWIGFENFLKDMGERPTPKHTLERKDTNGDYTPENCCWATQKEQQRNRTNNRIITFNGESLCLSEWEEKLNYPKGSLRSRLNKGWTDSRVLTQSYLFRKKPASP